MNRKNAKIIGIITVTSYVANYFLRNMLGVLTPAMLKTTSYTKEYIALLSSSYMITYAAGQLLNGILGDILKPGKMVLTGLLAAGTVMIAFPFIGKGVLQVTCFLILGYSLSMLRGPLMKVITENTVPDHARIICVFFSFSSFAGPLIASILAMIFHWRTAFVAAGIITVLVGTGAYSALSYLENKEIVSCRRLSYVTFSSLLEVFKIEGIWFYLIIVSLAEVFGTTLEFWMPTMLNEYILLDESTSNFIFSVIAFITAIVPFAALAIYKLFHEKDVQLIRVAFLVVTVSFAGMMVIPVGIVKVVLLLTIRVMNGFISALLWSIYIPGLGKTGRVSSINGIMDCTGYLAASVATTVFAYAVTNLGWNGSIMVWVLISAMGIVATFMKKEEATK